MSPSTSASVCSPLPSSGSRLPPVPHLHRYYGVVRLLPTHPGRLRSPLTARYLSPLDAAFAPLASASRPAGARPHCGQAVPYLSLREEAGGLPGSWGIPVNACPGLGTPAAPNDLAFAVVRMLSSARLTASTSATANDFGAVPSRPASSLPTLRPRQSPGERQGSLPACPLRLWPGWTFTSWIPSRGFRQLMVDFPLSQAWPGAIA
jgi:hypothetical protein